MSQLLNLYQNVYLGKVNELYLEALAAYASTH
jgi:hypothetical protein